MRYILTSIAIHVLIFSFIWVGFSVQSIRPKVSFVYLGEVITSDSSNQNNFLDKTKKSDSYLITTEDFSSSNAPWIKMRQVNKPR